MSKQESSGNRDCEQELERLKARVAELEAGEDFARHLTEALGKRTVAFDNSSVEDMAQSSVREIVRATGADKAILYVLDGDRLVLKGMSSGARDYSYNGPYVEKKGQCFCGRAAMGEAVFSDNILEDPRRQFEECALDGTRSIASLPLIRDGETRGVITLTSRREKAFQGKEQVLGALANTIAIELQNALNRQELAEKVEQSKAAEAESSRLRFQMQGIIDSMPSVLVGVDKQGVITQWNRRASETTGLDESRVLGKNLEQVAPHLARHMDKVRLALETGRPQLDVRGERQDNNTTFYENTTVYPLLTEGFQGAVILVEDISEKVAMEELVIQTEKMLSLGGLAAGMAHEINNPLAGVMGNAQVLAKRLSKDLPKNQRVADELGLSLDMLEKYMDERGVPRLLEGVLGSGRRAVTIVENMLSFGRKSDSQFVPHDLAELLEKTLEIASSDFDLKNGYDFREIEITREFDPATPKVMCDGSKIQQVFLNIIKNSAQAMKKAGNEQKPGLTLTLVPEGDMVRVEIRDNGPGMDEDTRRRIFEPFYTSGKSGKGTGLGMSISYFIVTQNHGGEIMVRSEPGRGACFVIRLPVSGPAR